MLKKKLQIKIITFAYPLCLNAGSRVDAGNEKKQRETRKNRFFSCFIHKKAVILQAILTCSAVFAGE